MRLLLVCLGNICRSPMAEGALRARLAGSVLTGQVQVDSAGTSDWHHGKAPDPRAVACARQHGVDISMLRARPVVKEDFSRFDWILCADASNLRDLRAMAPIASHGRIALWRTWAGTGDAIPDPYTGGAEAFEHVWQLVDAAAQASIQRLAEAANSGIISP